MLFELFKELYMYDEDINVIESLAKTYDEWCIENKYFSFEYEIVDIRDKLNTNDIIIIHNMWKENFEEYTVANGNSFISDIQCILSDYCDRNDSYEYCCKFWTNKLNGILTD